MTCGDAAVTGTVVTLHGPDAVVAVDGVEERVAIDLVPGALPGERLLCHAGVAIARAGPA